MTKRRPAGEVEIAGDSSSQCCQRCYCDHDFLLHLHSSQSSDHVVQVICISNPGSGDSMICSKCCGSTMTSLSFLPVNRARMSSCRTCASYTVPSSPKRWANQSAVFRSSVQDSALTFLAL